MSFKSNTSRGPLNCEKRSTLNHFIRSRNGWRYASMHQTITLVFLGLFISSSFALPLHIPADISYSRDGNSKLELFISPEDTFQMMQLLTSEGDRLKFQQHSLQQKHQPKYVTKQLGQPKLQHIKNAMSTPYIHKTSNGSIDYEDFPEAVPFLQTLSPNNKRSQGAKKKRYLGIDIPDYISSGGNPDAIKNMSSRLRALGKRR